MNDQLRKCLVCGRKECSHLERIVANALASVGTGVMDVDLNPRIMWTGSLQDRGKIAGRNAFVELKRSHQPISEGAKFTYRDITGELRTANGRRFEQRGFFLRDEGAGMEWSIASWSEAYRSWHGKRVALSEAAAIIDEWIRGGELPGDMSRWP
jgi:hypothetical protein